MRLWYALVPLLIGLIGVEALFEERAGSGNLREIQTRAADAGGARVQSAADGDTSAQAWFNLDAGDSEIALASNPAGGMPEHRHAGSGIDPPAGPEQIIAQGGARIALPQPELIERPAATD
jgi:hypothetical protein